MSSPTVDIIVPFYNRADLLTLCLKAMQRAVGAEVGAVIVVDDASAPEERAKLEALSGTVKLPLKIEAHVENQGFVKAIRTGMQSVRAPYVILLNSDTIPTPGFARDLVEVLARRTEFKAAAPISNATSDLFQWRPTAEVSPGPVVEMMKRIAEICGAARREYANKLTEPPFLTGMCLALPTQTFWDMGLLSEEYEHGYFEDLDLCCRLREAGHKLAIREDCFVYHRGQGSYRMMEESARGKMMQKNFWHFIERWGHMPGHDALMEAIDRASMQA